MGNSVGNRVSNTEGSMSDNGVGNTEGSVSNKGSMGNMDRGMGNRVGNGLRVRRSSLIGDLSDESGLVGSSVGGGLDSAVRESNSEGSSNVSVFVLVLVLLEVGVGIVVSYSILVGKGFRGLIISLSIIGSRGSREGSSSGYKSRGKDKLKIRIYQYRSLRKQNYFHIVKGSLRI